MGSMFFFLCSRRTSKIGSLIRRVQSLKLLMVLNNPFHSNNNIGNTEQINILTTIFNNLHILQVHTQIAHQHHQTHKSTKAKNGMPLHIQQQTYLKMMKYHLYQTMKITNHSNFHPNVVIIQTVPFSHHNKLMIDGLEKKQDMVYIINTNT